MLPLSKNSNIPIFYIMFAKLILVCSSFVILSSAEGENNINVFEIGETLHYDLRTKVVLNEKDGNKKHVGFYIDGKVDVSTLWSNLDIKILKIELKSPQLQVKSKNPQTSDGYAPHTSPLQSYPNKPFLIIWNKGKIEKILLPHNEPLPLINLKKGIASLFQFQLLNGEQKELDASGECTVSYHSSSPSNVVKTKSKCYGKDFSYIRHPDVVLDTIVESSRIVHYEIDTVKSCIKTIASKESHQMYLGARDDMGTYVISDQELTLSGSEKATKVYQGTDLEIVLNQISLDEKISYNRDTLIIQNEQLSDNTVESFTKTVDSLRSYLTNDLLGTLKPAKAFIKLINSARNAKKDDISKALGSKKNKNILPQLYDILGYVQTIDSHQAAVKKLHFDQEDQIDLTERYLWSLSFSSQPNSEIVEDLLNKFKNYKSVPEKLKETLILTISSMTRNLVKLNQENPAANNLAKKVEQVVLNELDYAQDEARYVFYRALQNLQSKSTIPRLLSGTKSEFNKETVMAWKAIKSFDQKYWNSEVIKAAERTFFQIGQKCDSSARTLAADILLEANPDDDMLNSFLNFLNSNDQQFEIKQYVLQRLRMIGEEDEKFNARLNSLIKGNQLINNYSVLSPRGSSTALKRQFGYNDTKSGGFTSILETKSNIVKRGIVSVVFNNNGKNHDLFSLGIFSSGFSSLVASDSNNINDEVDMDATTAGFELTVLGTQIRPFVFFNGQGELMGHVWSGTGSERTPAFQSLVMLQNHFENLRLSSGLIVTIDVKGVVSFDMSGQIEISLWNRNSKSLVDKSGGILAVGSMTINSDFIKTQVEFTASVEPKMTLQTDVDFSSKTAVCTKLSQHESIFRYNIFKDERIPGTNHKLRIAKYSKSLIPGKSHALNEKNSRLCSAMFIS